MAKKLTHSEWLDKNKNKIHNTLEILSQYNGIREKILVKCKTCGNEYYTYPSVLISGCRCKHCSNTKTNSDFIHELAEINPNIIPMDDYISDSEPILVQCKNCNHQWKARPTHLLRGHGCPTCAHELAGRKLRKTDNNFIEELEQNNPTVKYISGYKNRYSKVKVKSIICNHVWYASPNNLIFGQKSGCPICYMSHGEREIYNILDKNKINFVTQKIYENLLGVGNGNLSYDFYLADYNLLIEYQGEQHERPIDFNPKSKITPDAAFKIQKEHDQRKKEYAIRHNIDLLEIWYWDFNNIEQILNKKLNINKNKTKSIK